MARKNRGKTSQSASNSGLVMYTCLMIILLAFFVFLHSIAVVDERRMLEALGSLIGSLGILPEGPSAMGIKEKESIAEPARTPTDQISEQFWYQELIGKNKLESQVRAKDLKAQNTLTIQGELLFEPGGYEIKEEAHPFLQKVCEVINRSGYPVHIGVHTGDTPPSGEVSSSWELSALRALSIFKFFVHKGRVSSQRLWSSGYGEYSPVAPGRYPEDRAKNCQVEIVLDKRARERVMAVKQPPRYFSFKNFVFKIFKGSRGD